MLPPHVVRHDFLPDPIVATLLSFAEANQEAFKPSLLRTQSGERRLDPNVRISANLKDIDPLVPMLEARLTPVVPALTSELGSTPFDLSRIELELVAHNDGAFFATHIDTKRVEEGQRDMRVLSGVYYFHAMPKMFSGGALRLHAIGSSVGEFIDIEPVHNTLVVFPSWMPHEVRRVSVPSKRLMDSRFAINCWFRKPA